MKIISKPHYSEYARYYDQYLDLVSDQVRVLDQLKQSASDMTRLYRSASPEQLLYSYAPGKWHMKDIMMHLIDVERVFVYRAMRFARMDKTPHLFFDEKEFAQNAQATQLSPTKLIREYNASRKATIAFFDNLHTRQLKEMGWASQTQTSVRACVWIIYAHEVHHLRIIREKYLVK